MERLSQLNLTPQEKEYLREKCRDGICATVNDHECYVGMNFHA